MIQSNCISIDDLTFYDRMFLDYNTTARFHIVSTRYKGAQRELFKGFNLRNLCVLSKKTNESLFNKYKTIKELIKYNQELLDHRVIAPNAAVFSGENREEFNYLRFRGFTMKLIEEGITLHDLLMNPNMPLKLKQFYINQARDLMQKIYKIDKFTFYFNDIHSSNFIIDRKRFFKKNSIYSLDVDSSSINGSPVYIGKYIATNDLICDSKKYKLIDPNKKFTKKRCIQSMETEAFGFNMMVLEFLLDCTPDEEIVLESDLFCKYLNHLGSVGINKELIDGFYNLYEETSNIFPTSSQINSLTESQVRGAKFSEFVKKL